MRVKLNGKRLDIAEGSKVQDLGDYDIFVRNGYGIDKETTLCDGDSIIAVKKGEMPDENNLKQMLTARNGEYVCEKLRNSCVCVCGLGGLGSNIAEMLARLGVGKLVIADYDFVDVTNLNRQNYFASDIGLSKCQATENILKKITPYIQIETFCGYVNADNILQIAKDCSVVVEAFDCPKCKAEIVNSLIANTDKFVVASSGMAGYSSSNNIKTSHPMSRLYVAGDNESEAKEGQSLMSPRVSICAGHQANMVLRILLGEIDCD